MTGLALAFCDVPDTIAEEHPERVYERGGRQEMQFHWCQTPALLPVRWNGQFQTLRWGCKHRRDVLPYGG